MITEMIHHIRRSVLDKLATAETLRYGELKPKDLDGNVFTYHLKGLMVDNLVTKNDAGDYLLTDAGRDYIVHRYEDSTLSAHSIFLIVLTRGSEYLLRRRDVQPLIGYVGFVHGEPEAGVDVVLTAQERLSAKTGIDGVELSIAGSALISQYRDDELQSFSHAVILTGQTDQDIRIEGDDTGANFWSDLTDVQNLLPSCPDIVQMISKNQHHLQETYTLN